MCQLEPFQEVSRKKLPICERTPTPHPHSLCLSAPSLGFSPGVFLMILLTKLSYSVFGFCYCLFLNNSFFSSLEFIYR